MIQLNTTPPPLPEATEGSPAQSGNPAGWLGLCLAALAAGLAMGYESWLSTQEVAAELRATALAVVGACAVGLAIVGGACSLVSFFTGGSKRGAGIFIVATLGVLLNSGQVLITVGGGLEAVKAHASSLPKLSLSRSETTALREFESTSRDSRELLKSEFKNEGQLSTESELRHNTTLIKGLENVERSTAGNTAKSAAALKSFLVEMNAEFDGYQQEVKKMIQLSPMDPTRLKNQADLQIRQGVVSAFQKRNDEVEALMENALPRLERHLADAGVDEKVAAEVMTGAAQDLETRLEIIRQIRDTDRRIATSISEVLGLYETHWQEWKMDPAGQVVNFDDPEADAEIKRLFGEVEQAGRDQQYWHNRYVRTL